MKNKVFSLLLLGAMFTLPLSVHAEEPKVPSDFNDQKSVTVGDVDATVYSVDVEWGDLSYDWKYDSTTNKFEFRQPLNCQGVEANANYGIGYLQGERENGVKIFSDSTCSTLFEGEFAEGTVYYAQNGIYSSIRVLDHSIKGRVKANVEFTPSNSYSWVNGKFYQNYTFTPVTEKIQYQTELANGLLPVYDLQNGTREMFGYLKLDVNSNYNGTKTVEAGTTLGTVTLAISQDTD